MTLVLLKDDMLRELEDDDSPLKDVILVGSDGERVLATKAILATRSKVWKRMFFGNFQESTTNGNGEGKMTEVNMDYMGIVLRVVVKYCYTDELDLDLLMTETTTTTSSTTTTTATADGNANNSNNNNDNDDDVTDHMTDAEAVAMVQVRDAANYLELNDLHRTLSNELGESILSFENNDAGGRGDLACICAILQELMIRGESSTDTLDHENGRITQQGGEGQPPTLWDTCIDVVRLHPEACFLPKTNSVTAAHHNQGILACSLPLLTKLFDESPTNTHVVGYPFVCVKALKKWNEHHHCATTTSSEDDDEEDKAVGKKEIQRLADRMFLQFIPIEELAQLEPCSLFPMERLYKAFVRVGKSSSSTPSTTTPTVERQQQQQQQSPTAAGAVAAAAAALFPTSPMSTSSSSSSSSPPHVFHATVRGAGVDCANGVYNWCSFGYYRKTGKYGDMASNFLLRKDHEEEEGRSASGGGGGWKLVVVPVTTANSNNYTLYKAAAATSSTAANSKPPYALWNCVDGKEPTPYVTIIGSVPTSTTTSSASAADGGLASAARTFTFDTTTTATATNNLPANSNFDQLADAFRAQMAINHRNNNNNGNVSRTRARRRRR